MPNLDEAVGADLTGYQSIQPTGNPLVASSETNLQPGNTGYSRGPLPLLSNTSPDGLRNFYQGTVVTQARILNPPPAPIITATAVTNVTNVTNTTVSNPTQGFTSGNNANGYWAKDPTGLIRQWAQILSLGGGDFSVTFPVAFTDAVTVCPVAIAYYPAGDTGYLSIISISATGFVIHQNNLTGMSADWFAIGY